MAHISVVIPVYKAQDCLKELYQRLVSSLTTLTDDFEILLIEDRGGDNSWDIICELAQQDKRVKGIQFSRNFGQHYGITAGIDYCDGDWAIIMDCDLQDRPEEIPRLYAKAQEGYQVVLARRGKRSDRLFKRLGSQLFYRAFNYLADTRYDAEVGNFRIVSHQVVVAYRSMREQLRFFGGLVDWMGFSTASIDVQHSERYAGETSYTLTKLLKLASEAIIANSDKPLRLSVRLGFSLAGLSILFAIYIVIKALIFDTPVLGWSSLMVSIYFLGGIIISILGILGIYLGKTFDEAKSRPLYLIENSTFDNKRVKTERGASDVR